MTHSLVTNVLTLLDFLFEDDHSLPKRPRPGIQTSPTSENTSRSFHESASSIGAGRKVVSEEDLIKALKSHVLKNTDSRLNKVIPAILVLLDKGKFKALLSPDSHEFVYRLIDFRHPEQLAAILGERRPSEIRSDGEIVSLGKGVLNPLDELSSWTVNPRSLIYSGFFSVLPPKRNLVLFKAKVDHSDNSFFGNPDSMASGVDTDAGYWLERETIGCGPIHYDKAVYGFLRSGSSLEGLGMDLVNKVWKIKDVDFTDDYYLPKDLRP